MNLRSPLKHAHDLLRWSERYTQTDMVYLAKGGFWLVAGQAGAAITAFVFSILVANFLPQEAFGSYRYISSLISIVGAISLSGLGITIIRKVARGDDMALRRGFARTIQWSLPMMFCFFVVAAYYAYQGNYIFALAVLVGGLAMPFINGASLFNAYWNGKKDFKKQTLYWTGANVITTGCIGIAILLTDHITTLVSVFFVASAVSNLIFYWLTVKNVPKTPYKKDEEEARDGLHQSIINFLMMLSGQIDKIIVFQLMGPAQLAIYTFAVAIPEQLRGTAKTFARITLPRFAEQSIDHIRASIGNKIWRFALIASLLAIGYGVVAYPLFTFVFPQYLESIPYTIALSFLIVGGIGAAPLSALQAHARHKELYIHAIVSSALQVISTVVLIWYYGLWGAVTALIFNRIIVPFFLPWFLLKKEK